MSHLSLNRKAQQAGEPPEKAVWIFILVTLMLSIGILFLLPGLGGTSIIVFIPTVLAAMLIRYTFGKGQIGSRLFSRGQWGISLKWLLISLGLALALRLGVSLLGLAMVPDYLFRPGLFSPFLVIVLLFAAGEEIGWRGFALPTLLARGFRPLEATLLLAVPWALLHLPLVLPGMLSEGTPMVAEFLIVMSLAVLTTWVFLSSDRSLTAAVLLHGGQNMTSILNNGLDATASGWLMAAVYGAAAVLIILLTKGRLGLPAGQEKGKAR
jgi:membrane protease YdiL (CAAX protease family)